jgi:hypothetical protein
MTDKRQTWMAFGKVKKEQEMTKKRVAHRKRE